MLAHIQTVLKQDSFVGFGYISDARLPWIALAAAIKEQFDRVDLFL